MNITIDIGNTNIKLGIFQKDQLADHCFFDTEDALINFINKQKPADIICASVKTSLEKIKERILDKHSVLILNYLTPVPVNIRYQTPATLGTDRIACAVGAHLIFPEENVLIIDIGTCITYDFVDHKANYWGGGISPGLQMKLKALNTFTANLPLVSLKEKTPLVGGNTEQSILSGVVNGTKAEIVEIIRQYSDKFVNLKVLLCGGDVIFFESIKETHILVIPELVLIGLNRILQYNVSEEK